MSGQIVVWDSNVLIPLILPASKSSALFSRLQAARWTIAATPAILLEVQDKLETKDSLRKWLGLSDDDITQFVRQVLPSLLRIYPGTVSASGAVPADPDDEIVIAAALESQARYLVTEDKHLLALSQYQGVQVVDRDQFAAQLNKLGVP